MSELKVMTTRELLDSGIVLGEVGTVLATNLLAVEVAIEMTDPRVEPDEERLADEIDRLTVEVNEAHERIAIAHRSEQAVRQERDALTEEVAHLRLFKERTHEALDEVGVPSNPVSVYGRILSGERMVDRIRYLAASRDEWEKAAGHIGDRCRELRAALDRVPG